MTLPIARWLTMPGIRRTNDADTIVLAVQAFAPPDEADIERVDFALWSNGSPFQEVLAVPTVDTPALVYPDYSGAESPIPGEHVGLSMAGLVGYGITLTMADLPAGYFDVQATVTTMQGTTFIVPLSLKTPAAMLRFYNDKDGTDRRPNKLIRYVSEATGSDGNVGTIGSPMRTIQFASTSMSVGGDMGGATVHVLDGTTHVLNVFANPIFCSGDHWFTIYLADGVILQNGGNINVPTGRRLNVRVLGSGTAAAGKIGNPHLDMFVGGTDINGNVAHGRIWFDGVRCGSEWWDGPGTMSVNFLTSDPTSFAETLINVSGGSREKFVSCSRIEGKIMGLNFWDGVHDVFMQDIWGTLYGTGGGHQSAGFCNLYCKRQRNASSDIRGIMNATASVTGFAIQSNPDGKMRIQAQGVVLGGAAAVVGVAEALDIAWAAEEVMAGTAAQFRCRNSSLGAGNNVIAQVIGFGYTAGLAYIDLDVTTHTVGTESLAYAIDTVWRTPRSFQSDPYLIDVHLDAIAFNSGSLTNWIGAHFVCTDTFELPGFLGSSTMNRCVLYDIAMSAPQVDNVFLPRMSGAIGPMTDSVIAHVSFNGATLSCGGGSNLMVRDVVALRASFPTNGVAGCIIDSVHVIEHAAPGTNGSTGAWYEDGPHLAPFHHIPTDDNRDLSPSQYAFVPEEWWWDGATDASRGCLRPVGIQFWSEETPPITDLDTTATGNLDSAAAITMVVPTGTLTSTGDNTSCTGALPTAAIELSFGEGLSTLSIPVTHGVKQRGRPPWSR